MSGLCPCEHCQRARDWVQGFAAEVIKGVVEQSADRGASEMYYVGFALAHFAGVLAGYAATVEERQEVLEELVAEMRNGCDQQVRILREDGPLPDEAGALN